MGDVVVGGERIRSGVSGAEHAVLDGDACESGGELQRASIEVFRCAENLGEAGDGELEGLRVNTSAKGHSVFGDAFDGVGNGVDAGDGRHGDRLRECEFRVENGDLAAALGSPHAIFSWVLASAINA